MTGRDMLIADRTGHSTDGICVCVCVFDRLDGRGTRRRILIVHTVYVAVKMNRGKYKMYLYVTV